MLGQWFLAYPVNATLIEYYGSLIMFYITLVLGYRICNLIMAIVRGGTECEYMLRLRPIEIDVHLQ